MRKILFNDKYELTKLVREGRKTMTRRIIKQEVDIARHFNPNLFPKGCDPLAFYRDERGMCRLVDTNGCYIEPRYRVGEVVAVAQSYASILEELENLNNFTCMEHWESASDKRSHYGDLVHHPGALNKMFVRAEEMPHRIRITGIKAERLQDISDADCLKEGVSLAQIPFGYYVNGIDLKIPYYETDTGFEWKHKSFKTPKEAFAALIDKVSGKGTWESNPWVFAYSFELVKGGCQ